MWKITAFGLIVCLFIEGCAFTPVSPPVAPPPTLATRAAVPTATIGTPPTVTFDRDAEERAVYAALLDDPLLTFERKGAVVVVMDHTDDLMMLRRTSASRTLDRYFASAQSSMDTLTTETWDDFVAANDNPAPFPADLSLKLPYHTLSREERTALTKADADEMVALARLYDNATLIDSVSRVGFNATATQALVYRSSYSVNTGAEGYFYLLIKREGAWQMVDTMLLWEA